jgi:hypothetical protein
MVQHKGAEMTTLNYTESEVAEIVRRAEAAAHAAAHQFFYNKLGGKDQYACGFAWVDIYGVRSNSKVGKALAAAGIRKSYQKSLQMWNPSKFGCQNVDTLEEGARAAAAVFKQYGFEAYAGSRLD